MSLKRIYKYVGLIQTLMTTDEKIFIPFTCRRCAKCCREITEPPAEFDPFVISEYLKMPLKDTVEKYFGEIVELTKDEVKWKPRINTKPCIFLEDNKCIIYEVRPDSCAAFPIATDFGDCGLGCPGREEYVKARKALGKGIPYRATPIFTNPKPTTRIKRRKWKKHLAKYLSTSPSEKSIKQFIEVNKP
jgi:Fe-S-cluster containining protein